MSRSSFPQLLTRIDDLSRADHFHLDADDECYFFGEYTARAGYAAGPTNNLIHNFKKGLERKGRAEWRYKELAIKEAAAALSHALNPVFLQQATLVPIPPSKANSDPRYDDRVLRMLQQINPQNSPDIRELIVQHVTREVGAHDGERLGPDELVNLYAVDEGLCSPIPQAIGIFDDLLVTGASFVAAKHLLQSRFPGVKVYGFFLARRALPDPASLFGPVDPD